MFTIIRNIALFAISYNTDCSSRMSKLVHFYFTSILSIVFMQKKVSLVKLQQL